MTLYEKYNEILQSHSTWDYYKNSPNFNAMTEVYISKTLDYFFENDNAYYFIQKYFETGGKSMALEQITQMYNNAIPDYAQKLKNRFLHTLSAFFFGLCIAHSLWGKNECIFIVNNEIYDFIYVWFLTCLYHDVGYVFELDERIQNYIAHSKGKLNWNKMMKKYNLDLEIKKETLLRDLVDESQKDSSIKVRIQKTDIVVNTGLYTDTTIYNYGRYRAAEFGVLDHGLVGGMLLYKKLLEVYQSEFESFLYRKGKSLDEKPTIEFHNKLNLHFAPTHLILWNYISHCIVAHNIWKCPQDKKAIYNYFGLNNLIAHKFSKISLKHNPLLFLLSLVDTLEPIKRFDCVPKQLECIKKIQFCGCTNKNGKNQLCLKYSDDVIPEKLSNSLNDWIDLTAEAKDNWLKITFDSPKTKNEDDKVVINEIPEEEVRSLLSSTKT